MKNRLLLLVIFIVTILFLTSLSAFANRDFFYDLSNGMVTITGCTYSPVSLTIPKKIDGYPVVAIGDRAFFECSSLTSINIPDNITSIGNYAFFGCSNLTSINIPNGVSFIGTCAFYDCSNLNSISIPDSVTYIRNNAFYNTAYYNTDSNWVNGVLYIDNHLIKAKTDLLGIYTIKDGTKTISPAAFEDCKDCIKIIITDSVVFIGYNAFSNCSNLTSINIPDIVTSIYADTFYNCSSLTSINIPDNVTSIGRGAFEGCSSLTSIDIPNNVTSIGIGAFKGCSSLTSIDIPNNVTSIDGGTFKDCSNLTKIILPSSITRIVADAFPSGVTIYGFLGSLAEAFAETKGYDFVPLDDVIYTVKYDANGGVGSISGGSKAHDSPYTITDATPSKNGFTFMGWSTTPDGEVEYTSYSTYTKNADLTLYAVWKGPTVTVGDKTCAIGKSFDINVVLSDNSGLAGIGFSITYPDNMVLEKITKGDALSKLEMTVSNGLTANPVTVIFDGQDADSTNGVVFTLTFKVKEDATEGVYDIKIDVTDAHDNDMDGVDISDVNVKLTVKDFIPGDINGDGEIDLKDVTTIRRHLAGGYGVTVVDAALDVNSDGTVDLKDITYLRRALAGGYGIVLK